MIEQLELFFLQDALFLLGHLAQGDKAAREKLITHNLCLCVL